MSNDRIQWEFRNGVGRVVSNCCDVPARLPELNPDMTAWKAAAIGADAIEPLPPQPKREVVTVELWCKVCKKQFTYTGSAPKQKRKCDACITKMKQDNSKRQAAKRAERNRR